MLRKITPSSLVIILFFWANAIIAQTFPYGINYQGVARDANGNAQTMQNVNMRFTIAPSTSTTTIVYQETQTKMTNSMGQFNAVIGTGTSAQTFSNIVWAGNVYNLIVEINPGSGYVIISNQKMEAVPYALYSQSTNLKVPTVQTFTVGSGTYTTPAGVLYIKVRMAGGGGGGGSFVPSGTGTPGGNTTFGTSLLTAAGGAGGTVYNYNSAAGGTATIVTSSTVLKIIANTGGMGGPASNVSVSGSFNGGIGGANALGGAGQSSNAYAGFLNGLGAVANTGGGGAGGGTSSNAVSSPGGGGGAGGYLEALITNPSSTYSFSVGTGGTGAPGVGNTGSGGNGAAGIIIVEEYYQ